MASTERDNTNNLTAIIFFREDGWYPVEYPVGYSDWQAEADRNPGTIRIEDGLTGRILWPAENDDAPSKPD